MPEQTVADILVDAPAVAVLDVVADIDSYPQWADGIRAAQVLDVDDADRPRRARFTVSSLALTATYVVRYEWDVAGDGSGVVAWTLESGDVLSALDGSYTLRHEGGGTRVVYRLAIETSVSLPGLVRRRAEKSITTGALTSLRRRVHEGTAGS